MPDYKPVPTIPQFIYQVSTDTVYLDCIVTVPLPAHQGLTRPNYSYNSGTYTASKVYDHLTDNSQLNPYTYKDTFRVPVLSPSPILYTPNDKPGFISKLRPYLAQFYTLNAEVTLINHDPNTGGTGTGGLNNGGSFIIE